jgi:hypothetical protein
MLLLACPGLDGGDPRPAVVRRTCTCSSSETFSHHPSQHAGILSFDDGIMLRDHRRCCRVCEEPGMLTRTAAAAAVRATSSLLATHMDTKATTERPLEVMFMSCLAGGRI